MPRNQSGTLNDLPTTDNAQCIGGSAIAKRAIGRSQDGPDGLPPTVKLAAESVRREIQRLDELLGLLECAEVDLIDQERLGRDQSAALEHSRTRHLKRLIRYRRIRNRFREAEETDRADSSTKQIELDRSNRQLADAVAMLESARDARAMDADEHQTEIEGLREQLDLALRKAEESEAQLMQATARSARVSSELERACEQIIALETSLESLSSGAASGGAAENDETLRLLEEVQGEVEQLRKACRELNGENANLAKEIADLRMRAASRDVVVPQAAESMTWEQRKAAILEQLRQEDLGGAMPEQESQSLRQMIQKTSEEVEHRDREIAELRELLDQQSATFNARSNGDEVAMGAAGIAMMFDSDDLICEERGRLKEVQAEWDAKLRKAEVELSMERAKLARERRDVELKQGELEDKLRQIAQDQTPAQRQEEGKAPRRRWLTQLGLGDGG